ncbi:glycoside hydrolase family 61 protein [Moniliophthora roreri MCA 2997]|uniref:lytic cellulose monooxygenase (C4-dehydrogenating) n=1 Tax=Moniliophthora roreri (strain MCA 2997) TaxID=1381753 RepID=V2WXV6_MONRO|nr:glycoside hydrolase family 61 protein [Moniliophthora roreri MCA 2997]
MFSKLAAFVALAFSAQVLGHYTFPSLVVNGVTTPAWQNVRRTNNFNSRSPVQDVTSIDLRCYTSETGATAETIQVAAGSEITFLTDDNMYHQGVANVYMAKAPGDVSSWDGSGQVWFKVYEIPAVADGTTIEFPSTGLTGITFTIPKNLPDGQYLLRAEHIALHSASSFGGAQFYIGCAQVEVTGGGNGTPGPLVSIPGVYTGNEPGILINIYYPIPTSYTQPGPAVWSG